MSAWKDCVTIAMIGSAHAPPLALPDSILAALGDLSAVPEEVRLLTQAGALALWRRAGWKPVRNDEEVIPCEPEETPEISAASAGHLQAILHGGRDAALPEWLAEIGRVSQHLPAEHIPLTIGRAMHNRVPREIAMAAAGKRGQWLARKDSYWTYKKPDSEGDWETGTLEQREKILGRLRESSPAESRKKIAEAWATESARDRMRLLRQCETNLSNDDIPILENALDDRSKEVRRVAIHVLRRLPDSPFAARMCARAEPLLVLKRGGLLSRATLEVNLPPASDAAAVRDGLDLEVFGATKLLGERAILLLQIVSSVPLRFWSDRFHLPPADLLKAVEKSEFASAVATGWQAAAGRQHNAEWARALLACGVQIHADIIPFVPLYTILPEEECAEYLASFLRPGATQKLDEATWRMFDTYLCKIPGSIPVVAARAMIAALKFEAKGELPFFLKVLVDRFLLRTPPSLLAEAAQGWPLEHQHVREWVDLLTFRHEAITALNQP